MLKMMMMMMNQWNIRVAILATNGVMEIGFTTPVRSCNYCDCLHARDLCLNRFQPRLFMTAVVSFSSTI